MAWLLLLLGCFPDIAPPAPAGCTDCHGDPETGPAPPAALGGLTSPDHLGVGAHQAHSVGPVLAEPVACEECHRVPAATDDEGHMDSDWPAEVGWGALAATGGVSQPWDREEGTCTVYCHGSTTTGGALSTPPWTGSDGTASECGACHGSPPPWPHPQGIVCNDCHGQLTPETHINGTVDCFVDGMTGATTTTGGSGGTDAGSCDLLPCSVCHGTPESAAPPPDARGNTDPSNPGVGSHAEHLAGTATMQAVGCWTCHVETHGVSDPGHLDLSPAEVVFSGAAVAGGTAATYDPDSGTCTVWCHGTASSGGSNNSPVWTQVDGSQASCGTCHALPPPAPHPALTTCDNCHPVSTPKTHVNGVVDF